MNDNLHAIAACDEHLLSAMIWITGEDQAVSSVHRYTVRVFKEPDDHFNCSCKAPATYFIRMIEDQP